MAEAHAKLRIAASLFEKYELLSMQTLSIITFGKTTTRVNMEISDLFERHRGNIAEDRICNEEDCNNATLTLDSWENFYPMFLNIEQNQTFTLVNNNDLPYNFSRINVTDGGCNAVGPLVSVASSSRVTTTILAGLPAGCYYVGKWPAKACLLDSGSVSPILSKVCIRSTEAPSAPPSEVPNNAPVKAPVDPPATPAGEPVHMPASPQSAPVNTPVDTPVASPEANENNKPDLVPAVIVLGIAVVILLAVVIFLVYKLKKKEPHYEIIND